MPRKAAEDLEDGAGVLLKPPSKAQAEAGAEFQVGALLILLFITIVFPPIFVSVSFIEFVWSGDTTRALLVFVTFLIVVCHVFVLGRWSTTRAGAAVRLLNDWVAPFMLVWAFSHNVFTELPSFSQVIVDDPVALPGLLVKPMLMFAELSPSERMTLFLSSRRMQYGLMTLTYRVCLTLYRRACRPPTDGRTSAKDGQRNLRLVLVGDAFPPKVDGVATFSVHAIKHLKSFGHDVSVITSATGTKEQFANATIMRLSGFTTPKAKDHSVSIPSPMVFYYFLKAKPHAVHIFEVGILSLVMTFYCNVADIPCTFSHHTRIDMYVNMITPQFPVWLNSAILFGLERFFFPFCETHLAVCKPLWQKVVLRLGSLTTTDASTDLTSLIPTHNPGPGDKQPARNASGSFSSSPDMAKALASNYLGNTLRGNVRYWHSGVDEKFSSSTKGREEIIQKLRHRFSQGKPDLPLVIHVGRLAVEKFSEELAPIIRATEKRMGVDKVRFAIVGDGILMPEVKREVGENVFMAGFLTGQDLLDAYRCADVFFSPSASEAFPLVFLEAMRTGLAAVGPRAGGVPETVEDGNQGTLFKAHDAESAADAIERAIKAGGPMRERAIAHGESFTWRRSIRELEAAMVYAVEKKEKCVAAGFFGKPTSAPRRIRKDS